ncbi:hypothetical protein [Shewanella loihica]|uniref:hypothetical protein n=1 Tax=Shewanella loihica TaxID=359303 RepID=UPI00123227DA|nr:hypothetical protein [Shewanella loihica]
MRRHDAALFYIFYNVFDIRVYLGAISGQLVHEILARKNQAKKKKSKKTWGKKTGRKKTRSKKAGSKKWALQLESKNDDLYEFTGKYKSRYAPLTAARCRR